MNPGPTGQSAPASRGTSFALVCFAAWATAAASTRIFGIWPAIGGAALALGIAVLVVDGAASRLLLRPDARRVLIGAAAGGSMAGATYLVYPELARLVPFIASDAARLYSAFRAPPLALASLALAPVILGEELVWRGVVQGALARRFGHWGAVALAAAAYALAHLPLGSPTLVLVALACGLAWGGLRVATGSLVPALVAHLVWDLLVLLWKPLVSR